MEVKNSKEKIKNFELLISVEKQENEIVRQKTVEIEMELFLAK